MKIPLGPALAVAFITIVAGMGLAAWIWWDKNAEHLKESAVAAYAERQRVATALDENGCVSEAIARHSERANQTFVESVRTDLVLRGCLDASKKEPKFCSEVPAKLEVISVAAWSAQSCADIGFTDSYCGQMMYQIVEYCSSDPRVRRSEAH